MKETIEFEFNGHRATVIKPECPNGKWIWKTEFLYAFDKAEERLSDMGYTRVYYSVSNMYGSYRAVRLMHEFYRYIVKEKNGSDSGEEERIFGKMDMQAFNNAIKALDSLTEIKKGINGLSGETTTNEENQTGVVILPEVEEEE